MNMGVFPSGQWGQTVNLLLSASVVRIHPRPPKNLTVCKYAEVFVLLVRETHKCGWIRTASTRRTVRRVKKPLCNSDDRCQRQKQGGAVGAAASRMRVPPKARCSRWEPRPGLLFCAARAIHPRPLKTSAYASTLRFLFSPAFPSPAKNTCISGTSCYDTNQKKSYKVIRRY